MSPLSVEEVNNTVRPLFEGNVEYVKQFLHGRGIDMGCGSCPLLTPPCEYYIDISPQPLAVEQVGIVGGFFIQDDLENVILYDNYDFIFSSHALEDLVDESAIRSCLLRWATYLKIGGHIVLLMPDMEGGRYPKVGEENGNISHHVNVGVDFMRNMTPSLLGLSLTQIDTIPHTSDTFDVVFTKV